MDYYTYYMLMVRNRKNQHKEGIDAASNDDLYYDWDEDDVFNDDVKIDTADEVRDDVQQGNEHREGTADTGAKENPYKFVIKKDEGVNTVPQKDTKVTRTDNEKIKDRGSETEVYKFIIKESNNRNLKVDSKEQNTSNDRRDTSNDKEKSTDNRKDQEYYFMGYSPGMSKRNK